MKKIVLLTGFVFLFFSGFSQIIPPFNQGKVTEAGDLWRWTQEQSASNKHAFKGLLSKQALNPSELHLDSILIIEELAMYMEYNSQGWLTTELESVYDFSTQTYLPDYRQVYTYTSEGWPESSTSEVFETGEWIPDYRYEATYNASGFLLTETNYFYEAGNQSFVPAYQSVYYLNTNNFIDSIYTYSWDPSQEDWDIASRSIQMNNSLGDPTQIDYSYYDQTNMIWIEYTKEQYQYQYDNQDRLIEEIYQEWDFGTSDWIYTYKNEYGYQFDEVLASTIESYWDEVSGTWQIGYLLSNEFDSLTNLSASTYSYYDELTGGIENDERYEASHHFDFLAADYASPAWMQDEFYHVNIIDELNFFFWEDSNWELYQKAEFYYTPIQSIHSTELLGIQVYPNPVTNGRLFLQFEESPTGKAVFQLYDASGKQVLTHNLQGNTEISLEQLPSGIYLYQVNTNDQRLNQGRLIIP